MSRRGFWSEVFTLNGSVTPYIKYRVLGFVGVSALVSVAAEFGHFQTGFGVAPYEIVGVVLALLLVLRTNSGYDRWYEGRKLWGGIVNQSRNLVILALAHGPEDRRWRDQFVRWTAAFCHTCRHSLRSECSLDDMSHILNDEERRELEGAQHMPSFVAGKLDGLLREATASGGLDRFAFIQLQNERAQLIDHVGACERILKTPLAQVFSIKIRRFLFLYLIVLPLAIVDKTGLTTPIITLLVAYPLLSLDQIGIELQDPFSRHRLSHLPLQDICKTITDNLFALYDEPISLAADKPQSPGKADAELASSSV